MADLPDGEPAPPDGSLPNPSIAEGFSAYVHIPFCAVRCGYCDFNTYTNRNFGPGAGLADFPESLGREIALSRAVLEGDGQITTVFFGGGTPTMLDSGQLTGVLASLNDHFGIAPGAEITTEANPETVTRESLRQLREGGFTRVSFGMQSAVPRVLSILDRQHRVSQVPRVVEWAREAGLDVSLDLIYGAPGETEAEWRSSLQAALSMEPDHISAYALTVEPGTKMGAQVRRGQICLPDPDEQADRYELAAGVLEASGYHWYEISNWAKIGHECQHNLAYWRGANWWGYGPGAHSHVGGTRFWNVKHPLAYANKLLDNTSPVAAREVLTQAELAEEDVMLRIRLAEGIAIPEGVGANVVAGFISDGLVDPSAAFGGRLVLTLKGRLLADTVTRALWEAMPSF